MKSYSYYGQTVAVVPSPKSTSAIPSSDVWIGLCILTFPIMVVLAVLSYRRHRTRTLQNQIVRLEKLWRLNTGQDSVKE